MFRFEKRSTGLLSLVAILALVFAFVVPNAMACEGPDCHGSGNFDISANAGSANSEGGLEYVPNGVAGGVSGAAGGTTSGAIGYANNADVDGTLNVVGGGLTYHKTYMFNVPEASRSIGVGSTSSAEAVINGRVELSADADGPRCWYDFGHYTDYGFATGAFVGGAAQGTLDGSLIGESPVFFDTNGFSGGIAGQGSIGYIEGGAIAESSGFNGYNPASVWSEAGINMFGASFSESYRYVNYENGSKTEGMGTNVFANTNVTSYGDDGTTDGRLRFSSVAGDFCVNGGAAAMTVQTGPGLSGAVATAVGSYAGSGELGCGYTGVVNGYTRTSVTTFNGMNGSINSASSGMSISSHTQSASPQIN